MNIRIKLAAQFAIIVTLILMFLTGSVYYFSAQDRKNVFYSRLKDRAVTTANLLIEVKEVDSLLLKIINKNTVVLYDERIKIFNYKNQEIYSSNENDTAKISTAYINKIKLKRELRDENGEREILGITYSEYPTTYVIVASAHDIYGIRKLHNLKIILISGLLFCFIITIFSGMFYAGRALKPLKNMIKQSDNITASNLNFRIEAGNSKDEIGRLAVAFNNVLTRLETSFDMQKNFVHIASHEFRTPVTFMLGEIERILDKNRSGKEYVETLKALFSETKNLNIITESMLGLAQASLDISSFRVEEVRIDELIFDSKVSLLKKKSNYSVDIFFENISEDTPPFTLTGNEFLLKTTFVNLMENGCKYSGTSNVTVRLYRDNGYICIGFSDSGIGIPAEDIPYLFESFKRCSNVGERKGYGIGLSLAKKIVDLHKGKIEIISEVNKGSVFTVIFPDKDF